MNARTDKAARSGAIDSGSADTGSISSGSINSGPINSEAATTRLSRLLTMVPWLMNRQGIDIEEAARTLGVSRAQIEADLELLFVCGTPGHMPDDLIEAEWEQGRVYIRNADAIAKPLRFTRDEALALTVGLRTLLDVPGLQERDAVDRALAKLSEATGESGAARVHVSLERDGEQVLSTLQDAVRRAHRVHLRYLAPARDEVTERDVDPLRLFTSDGHWYLEGWCRRAEGMRTFRLDRIESVELLDVQAEIPQDAQRTDLSRGFFAPSPDAPQVRLRVQRAAFWIIDYYPCFDVERSDDGEHADVSLVLGDGRWLRRLLLQLGRDAQVLAPAAVRAQVADEARRALDAYAEMLEGTVP